MTRNPCKIKIPSSVASSATWPIATRTDHTCFLPQFTAVSVAIGITSDKHRNKSHASRLIRVRSVTAKGVSPHKEPTTMRRTALGGCSAAKWYWRVTDQLSVGECRPRSYITTTSDTVQLWETKLKPQYRGLFRLQETIIIFLYSCFHYHHNFSNFINLFSISKFSIFLPLSSWMCHDFVLLLYRHPSHLSYDNSFRFAPTCNSESQTHYKFRDKESRFLSIKINKHYVTHLPLQQRVVSP